MITDTGTRAGFILSFPPLVAVGLWSYSAYLWHQPLFALSHYVSLDETLTMALRVALCFLTLVIAYASWRWVETPFRDRFRISRRQLITVLASASVFLLSIGLTLALPKTPPRPGRLLSTRLVDTLTLTAIADASRNCGLPPGALSSAPGCLLNQSLADAPTFVVLGDSHAGAVLPSFQRIAQRLGQQGRLVTVTGCPPLVGVDRLTGFTKCRSVQSDTVDFVKRQHVKRVFLIARWTDYTNNNWANWIKVKDEVPADGRMPRMEFVRRLRETVDTYTSLGVDLYIVEQVPQQIHRPIAIYIRSLLQRTPQQEIDRLSVTRAEHDALQKFVRATFAPYRSENQVSFIDLSGALCNTAVCPVGNERESYYADFTHLSSAGADVVTDLLEKAAFRSANPGGR